jgi:hypothetical protein
LRPAGHQTDPGDSGIDGWICWRIWRALQSFPAQVRTLDGLRLASVTFLIERGHDVALASYDARMRAAAGAMGLQLDPLE